VVAVDRSKLPPDHTEAYERLPVIPMPRSSGHDLKLIQQTSIRVMVNYTAAAAAASGDINGLIDLAVAETNQGYDNSGVQIDLILANKSQVTYTETGIDSTDLARYRGTSDGYMDSIHSTRSANTADVGVLIVANAGGCGLASSIGSSFTTAFALVLWNCATGNYTFGHEIGHLQSARHDPATDPTNTPYPFGHGYRYTGSPAWRTIMAYPCPTVSCPRLNNWSTPYRTKNGLPMGTVNQSNNVRVLNTTKTTVAGFFAPACIPDGGVDDTLYVTSCCSGYAVQGSTYCTNPADYGTTWASCKHVCGTAPVNGCIPSGGIDDILGLTSCCSGAAVAGSGWCLDQTDWGTNWASCVQTCQ
jgi:hypothetical protein